MPQTKQIGDVGEKRWRGKLQALAVSLLERMDNHKACIER